MIAHQAKKLGDDALQAFRDRFQIPVSDEDLHKVPFLRFAEDSTEMKYLRARRDALGGYLPARRRTSAPLDIPPLSTFDALLKATARGARDLDHDGVRAHPHRAAARQGARPARRADRARREPHLRHGGAVPPGRHLQPGRPALPAAGRRPAHVLPRGHARGRSCRRASTSRARWPRSSPRGRRTRPRTSR